MAKWRKTSECRVSIITENDSQLQLQEYFNRFPALKLDNGYELLVIDFLYLYPEKEHFFVTNIVLLSDQIIGEAKKKRHESKVEDVQKGLNEILGLLDPTKVDITNATNKSVIAVCLLPFIMNNTPSKKKTRKGKMYKFSREEKRDSFTTLVHSDDEIGTTIIRRTEKYFKIGSLQPYIIAVGADWLNIEKAIVVVDNTQYKLGGLIEAVDVLFKIFHATNTCYPEEAYDVWLFIQKGMYGITTKCDDMRKPLRSLLDTVQLPNSN